MTVNVGEELPPFTIDRVDPDAMVTWARLLHDPNPIHLDREAVRAAGLGERRINQGPANLAYIINMLHAAFPGGRVGALDMRYMANVLEDDAVVARGVVASIDGDTVSCDVWLDVEGRGKALAGTAQVIVQKPTQPVEE